MQRFLRTSLAVIVGLVLLVFAVANRQLVPVSFDPFGSDAAALTVTVPLFVLILLCLLIGVLVGGSASWMRQSHYRRRARHLAQEVRALRAERDAARAAAISNPAGSGTGTGLARLRVGSRSAA